MTADYQLTDDDFWTARPHLAHIRTAAHSRLTGPWAVLGCILARTIGATLPDLTLPPIIMGRGSLNLFVGLVAPSGGGKGGAEATAADLLPMTSERLYITGPGSGEGIPRIYRYRDKKSGQIEDVRPNALMRVGEVDQLVNLGRRQGATLLPVLREAWSGASLGFQNLDQERTIPLPAHSYRLCLVVGIQPRRAQALLDDADGGTPQRFLWMPVLDPRMPTTTPDWPGELPWRQRATAHRSMLIPKTVHHEIRAAQLAVHHTGEEDPLGGQSRLSRLKVAAGLALLDGRHDIAIDDWDLSAVVMRCSDTTRAAVQHDIHTAMLDEEDALAARLAYRNNSVRDGQEKDAAERVRDRLLTELTKTGEITWSEFNRRLRSELREHLGDVVEQLQREDVIDVRDNPKGGKPVIALNPFHVTVRPIRPARRSVS